MSKFVLAAALCVAVASAADEAAPKWWYGPSVEEIKGYGPEDWAHGVGFEACGGDRQSPINFAAPTVMNKDMKDSTLSVTSRGCSSDVVGYYVTGYGWQVNMDACEAKNNAHFNDKTYELLQFHFHTPSEHTVGGGHHDADVHMVHVNVDDPTDLLVIGVFIDAASEWSDNTVLDKFWPGLEASAEEVYNAEEGEETGHRRLRRRLQDTSDSDMAHEMVYPYEILPGVMDYFTYLGSLTTPPCSEIVTWVHMSEVIPMSTVQFEKFHDGVANHPETQMHKGHSNRPTQDLNDRAVHYYS